MRWYHRIAVFFFIALCLPACVPADGTGPSPLVTIPANDTPLVNIAQGSPVPLSALQTHEEITLLDLESNQSVFPGPRSIRLETDLPTLAILSAGGCLIVAIAVLSRKRMAAKKPEEAAGEEPETEITSGPGK